MQVPKHYSQAAKPPSLRKNCPTRYSECSTGFARLHSGARCVRAPAGGNRKTPNGGGRASVWPHCRETTSPERPPIPRHLHFSVANRRPLARGAAATQTLQGAGKKRKRAFPRVTNASPPRR